MIIKTKFKDLVIHINKPYRDKRGYLKELLRENKIKNNQRGNIEVIYESYCGGFPAIPNDFRYKFSWSFIF